MKGLSEPTLRVDDYLAAYLARRGVSHVYEVVGGMITLLLDALHRDGRVAIVSVHHEQSAAFAAEGYARSCGLPTVAMATSGPGATNLLTGIGSCYFDSVPAVFITGQVNRHEQKGARGVRQLGFQETDIVSMARPITKAALLVNDPEQFPAMLDEAFALAVEGRPGPVLLDIPMDVQRSDTGLVELRPDPVRDLQHPVNENDLTKVIECLHNAKRPLLIAGGGIHAAGSLSLFRQFAEASGVPAVCSLMAVDALPWDHPLRVGFFGSYGNRWSNLAIGEADALIVLGSRLDIRQTGSDVDGFRGDRQIIHVDIDADERNNRVLGCDEVDADLGAFFRRMLEKIPAQDQALPQYTAWFERLAELRKKWPDDAELEAGDGINPNIFFHQLSRKSNQASGYTVDVGQNQMWAAQSLELGAEQRFFTSGGMGALGFSLPAAIGAVQASGRPVVVIAGDGGFQFNIQELQTVARLGLPLKMVVLDNGAHGMVRQFQQSYFNGRYQSTIEGYSAPDFVAVARAYGIKASAVTSPGNVSAGLDALWEDPSAPFLLQVKLDTLLNVYPKIAFGRPLNEMEPDVAPDGMEST